MDRTDLTLVTGATGFIGGHLVRALLKKGESIRVLVRRTSSLKNLEGLAVDLVYGDLTDPGSLREALRGCLKLYHAAADYRLGVLHPEELYRVNVEGTRNILLAAVKVGIRRVVYTSTVGALGCPQNGTAADEETPVALQEMVGHYKRSKFLAEAEARQAAQKGLPVVIVNPSTPVGSGDVKPTPTGQMIVDFLNGRMPAYVETGLNLIDVEDVAEGHLLAMEKGRAGQRYILGHRNLTLRQILEILSSIADRPAPKIRLPHAVAFGVAVVSTGVGFLTRRPARVSLEAVRMSRKRMFFDSTKAVRELGLPQRSVEEALAKAVDWFKRHGYAR